MTDHDNSGGVYDAVRAYELAFSYRNIQSEVDAVLGWATEVLGHAPESAADIAAGAGDHVLELASRGILTWAVDNSEQMSRRIRQRSQHAGLPVHVTTADMRDFRLSEPVDLVITMLDSVSHLLTLDDLLMYLSCVGNSLRDGGCCIVEMSHPRDFIGPKPSTSTEWTEVRGAERVTIRWGGGRAGTPDPIDPITQVSAARVSIDYVSGSNPPLEIDEVVLQRGWTATEVEAAVRLTSSLAIARRYGSFEGDPLDAEKAWRMIVVLRRRER